MGSLLHCKITNQNIEELPFRHIVCKETGNESNLYSVYARNDSYSTIGIGQEEHKEEDLCEFNYPHLYMIYVKGNSARTAAFSFS